MENFYCVKCKRKTNNNGDDKIKITKNNRKLLMVKCIECNTQKSSFIK